MPELPYPIPTAIDALPKNRVGYPVPWFVAWIGGEPDFRVIEAGRIEEALARGRCWVCGRRMMDLAVQAFVIGPMCAVNRVTAEPPSHLQCARWSAIACPFLSRPQMGRRERDRPEGVVAGEMIPRNPGVALVWKTRPGRWEPFAVENGLLFDVGDPIGCEWYSHGRPATREEVLESVESGLPILRGMAEEEGADAVAELERMRGEAMRLLPAAV